MYSFTHRLEGVHKLLLCLFFSGSQFCGTSQKLRLGEYKYKCMPLASVLQPSFVDRLPFCVADRKLILPSPLPPTAILFSLYDHE